MTCFEPGSQDSPDRMDALVWSLTNLMIAFDQPISFAMPHIVRTPYGRDVLLSIVRDPQNQEHPLQAHGPEYSGGFDLSGYRFKL